MKTILIAGAGQLGSRHLQGVKTSKNELDIWVYDLCKESLKVAEVRYNQVESKNKTAHFVDTLEEVPNNIDVLIDGPFIENLKDTELELRGSSNQRIIQLKIDKK